MRHGNPNNNFRFEIAGSFFDDNGFRIRNTNNSDTAPWRTIIHSGNFNSYSPTLTGGGASGTWGINISGLAANSTLWSNLGFNSGKDISTPTVLPAFDGTDIVGYVNATNARTWLGMPSGGETLQSVTNRDNGTANPLFIYKEAIGYPTLSDIKSPGLRIRSNNALYGFNFGLEQASGNGWIQAQRNDTNQAYSIILNPAGGNVGIGTSITTERLTVDGNISANALYANNWFRSYGNNGWFNETHLGGIYMEDSTWVRVYGGKKFRAENDIFSATKIEAPVLKAIDKLLIPTAPPSSLASGEAAMWIGNLSGITT